MVEILRLDHICSFDKLEPLRQITTSKQTRSFVHCIGRLRFKVCLAGVPPIGRTNFRMKSRIQFFVVQKLQNQAVRNLMYRSVKNKKKQVRFCWFPQLAYSKHFSQKNPTPTGPTAQRGPAVPVRLRMALQREYEMNKWCHHTSASSPICVLLN